VLAFRLLFTLSSENEIFQRAGKTGVFLELSRSDSTSFYIKSQSRFMGGIVLAKDYY
jgi:hypothetical protein